MSQERERKSYPCRRPPPPPSSRARPTLTPRPLPNPVLAPGVNRYFTKTEKDILALARTVDTTGEDGATTSQPTSKKDPGQRRGEHLKHVAPALRSALVKNADALRTVLLDTSLLGVARELCRCAPGKELAAAVADHALGDESGDDLEAEVSVEVTVVGSGRIPSYRIASHRIASHRIASHRIASHRIASHRITSNLRCAPPRTHDYGAHNNQRTPLKSILATGPGQKGIKWMIQDEAESVESKNTAHEDEAMRFAPVIIDALTAEDDARLDKWTEHNRACFTLLSLLRYPDEERVSALKAVLSKRKGAIKKKLKEKKKGGGKAPVVGIEKVLAEL